MKLAVSNIAWDLQEEAEVLSALSAAGVAGIEVAPTKVWPGWEGATAGAAHRLKQHLTGRGFAIPALQSVLFDRPDLHLFGNGRTQRALRDHLRRVGELACALGAPVIVFGSPRNRDRGARTLEEATEEAATFLALIGDDLAALDVCMCIEANPADYGCNFVTRWHEAAELVHRVGSPGIGLHLDVACTILAGDDPVDAIEACSGKLRHFHISEPQLGGFTTPTIDHAVVGDALRASGYQGWLSIEMRRQSKSVQNIKEAILLARSCYG